MASEEMKGGMINAILGYCNSYEDAKRYRTDCVLLENGKLIATDGDAICIVEKSWLGVKDNMKGLFNLQQQKFYKNKSYYLRFYETHIQIAEDSLREVSQDGDIFPDWEAAIKTRKTKAHTASFPAKEIKRLYDLAEACGAKSITLTPKGDDPMKVKIDGGTADATVYVCPLEMLI